MRSSAACKVFDFTIGDEPYKRDWCDTEHAALRPRFGGDAARLADGRCRPRCAPVKRWVKQTPAIWSTSARRG